MSLLDESVRCEDERARRAAVLGHATLNGLDFLEVDTADPTLLHVHVLNELPADAYDLEDEPERITVTGGTRITGIRVLSAERVEQRQLDVRVDRVGDFSPYELHVDADELDPRFRRLSFSFRPGCPVDVAPTPADDAPASGPAPELDYLAKDYASFRRLLLDLAPQLNPRFTEQNPADLGVALVELLAYAGDRLSYFQDAVANEAFLETARTRVSLRRLARLVDYRVHEGANASTHLHVTVGEGVGGGQLLPRGTRAVTRIVLPLRTEERPPGVVVDPDRITAEALETDPALVGAAVFETAHDITCFAVNNEVLLHTWGNEECRLPEGATQAWLFATPGGSSTAVRPELAAGDLLLLEETHGPVTGLAADADPTRRQVVELVDVEATEDALFAATLLDGELQLRDGSPALPLLRVRWRREDALRFSFCLSRRDVELGLLRDLTRARGNVVVADHGLSTTEEHELAAPAGGRFRLRLGRGPLTIVGGERPAVELDVEVVGEDPERWRPVPDLLDSPPFAPDFVAEPGDDGRALLRFGDGEYGRSIAGAVAITARYRVGNGRAGNVGAGAIVHLAPSAGPTSWIAGVRNPLPAAGGSDPEPLEQVRSRAPEAFRATQFRAVTAADWEAGARDAPDVQGAVADFRWTGSWYTVSVAVDPRLAADLVTGTGGRLLLHPDFERRTRARLERYRLAGYDLRLLAPTFVPLELELEVCVAPGYFRSDVAAAVAEALSTRTLRGGRRGFFHPENLTFGTPVYLSRIYAAVEAVDGVDTAVVRVFRRYGRASAGELEAGVLSLGRGEIAQLENDQNFLEHGVLRVEALGGKA